MDKKVITTNRKAFHDYTISEKYIAGIVLTGTEIKSIRKNAINLKDSFCKIVPLEVFIQKGFAKVEIGLAKGKKLYDKRDSLAKKDQQREIDRKMKY